MKNWGRERWRKLYLRESVEKGLVLLMARALEAYLVKRAEDDGRLAASPEILVAALHPHPHELELATEAVTALLGDGFLEVRPTGVYVANLPEAQGDEPTTDDVLGELDKLVVDLTPGVQQPSPATAPQAPPAKRKPVSGRERTAQWRANRTAALAAAAQAAEAPSQPSSPVTSPSVTKPVTTIVTGDVTETPSPLALPSPSQPEQPEKPARVSEARALTHSVSVTECVTSSVTEERHQSSDAASPVSVTRHPVDSTDSETATRIPLDLLDRAERLGVIQWLAAALKQDVDVIRASANEFVSYWTIGEGAGQARRRWMRKLREHVRKSANQGKLPAPGLLGHQASEGLPPGWKKHPAGLGWLDEQGSHRSKLPPGYGPRKAPAEVKNLLAGIGNGPPKPERTMRVVTNEAGTQVLEEVIAR